jgi:curved DNA-binding protein CbpA
MNLLTCFKILGLSADADADRAKQAYKARVKRWHPDRFAEDAAAKARAEEQLKQINVAYAQVKAHLASRRPAPEAKPEPAPPPPPRGADSSQSASKKGGQRSWFDTLFNAVNRFVADRPAAPSAKSQQERPPSCRKSFGQVLDEMAGGTISPPKGRRKGRSGNFRNRAAAYRRHRRGGSSADAVGGAERPGPVRPVSRVRGIGKSR